MRLTKTQLKQVIKEELQLAIREQLAPKEWKAYQMKAAQRKKEKATFTNALKKFTRSLATNYHQAASGEWIEDLYKVAKNSISKGDYAQALKDVTKAAVYHKLPKVGILTSALKALKDVEVPKASIDAMAAFGSAGGRKI